MIMLVVVPLRCRHNHIDKYVTLDGPRGLALQFHATTI